MKVKELYIYPIKSLQGIKVPSANVLEKGFEYDRRWMLVDQQGVFITQRRYPLLHNFKLNLQNGDIQVTYNGDDTIFIPQVAEGDKSLLVKVWESSVKAIVAPEAINSWFSNKLTMKCSLVYMPENTGRLTNSGPSSTVSFADSYPYLVLGEKSMSDLNSRMKEDLPIHRFRPNIVFEGDEAYNEDLWRDFKIGEVTFKGIKPCVRCVFTTIDQETGKMGKEPLKTLATYRKNEKGVIFGLNAISHQLGTIKVGDQIEVLSKENRN